MVNEVELGQVLLRVLRFSPLNIIPASLHTHLAPPHEVYNSPEQAAHYHTLGPKLGASFMPRHLAGAEEKEYFFYYNIYETTD
jgi:hypothetical protein